MNYTNAFGTNIKKLYPSEQEVTPLVEEYCSLVGLYVSKVTKTKNFNQLIKYSRVIAELYNIREFKELVLNINSKYDWKEILLNSRFYNSDSDSIYNKLETARKQAKDCLIFIDETFEQTVEETIL